MESSDRQAHYGTALSRLLDEAVTKHEVALLLEAITTALGAMGSVIEDPEHRRMYIQDITQHVGYNIQRMRETRADK
jgi:hypothetical protein